MNILNRIQNKLKLSTSKRKIYDNIFWAVLGKVINILSGLFVGILVARYLGPEQYGLMSYVISYVALFSVFASFGLDGIEIRELAKKSWSKEQIIGTSLTLRFFFAFFTVVLILITLFFFETDRFTFWLILIYSSTLIFDTFKVIKNYFTAIILNKHIVKTEIVRTLIGASIKVLLLINYAPLEWFIVAATFEFLIIAGGYILSYKKNIGDVRKWSFNKEIAFYLINQSFPLLLSGAAVIIYQKIDQIIIKNLIDSSAVGQYAVAARLSEFVVFIPILLTNTLSPVLIKLYKTEFYDQKKQYFIDVIFWSSFLLSSVMFILAKFMITVLFGTEYLDAIPVLQILSWKAILVALAISSGQIIIIEGLHKFVVFRNVIGLVFSIALNFLFIPLYGIIGSAISSLITVFAAGYLSHSIIPKYRDVQKYQTNTILFGLKRVIIRISQNLKMNK